MDGGKPDFESLCASFLEGRLTRDEEAKFVELLRTNGEAREAYVVQMHVHALLAWQHHPLPCALPTAVPRAGKAFGFPFRLPFFAAAALFLLCGLAAWWWVRGTPFDVLEAGVAGYRVGEHRRGRVIEIGGGELQIQLSSGAVVSLTGPATLRLWDAMHVRLLRGCATVDVGTRARGFVVDTPTAHVVDLGTRFGVSADGVQATEVAVFEGKVEVYQPSRNKGTERQPEAVLLAGEAVRVGGRREPVRVKLIALGRESNSMDATRASDLVSGVTDNVAEPGFRGYYGLARGDMGEGAEVYTTGHARKWHPLKGETFPAELERADAIRTFSFDRSVADLEITLQITRPCDLYVMLDVRAPAPEWVRQDFVNTGHRIRSGPWIPRETPPAEVPRWYQDEKSYYAFAVWKRRVAVPGPVTLGSPLNPESPEDKPFMYGLAVKRAP